MPFGVSACFMITATGKNMLLTMSLKVDQIMRPYFTVIFIVGRIFRLYKIRNPEENIIIKTAGCLKVIRTEN